MYIAFRVGFTTGFQLYVNQLYVYCVISLRIRVSLWFFFILLLYICPVWCGVGVGVYSIEMPRVSYRQQCATSRCLFPPACHDYDYFFPDRIYFMSITIVVFTFCLISDGFDALQNILSCHAEDIAELHFISLFIYIVVVVAAIHVVKCRSLITWIRNICIKICLDRWQGKFDYLHFCNDKKNFVSAKITRKLRKKSTCSLFENVE